MIQVKVLKTRPFRKKAFTEEIHKELRNQGQISKRMLEKVGKTWSKKPTFTVKAYTRGLDTGVEVTTKDQRFKWLNEGTKTRWAVMSRDFSPKTTHRTIGSRVGSGRVIIRGKSAMTKRNIAPRPGIKAREWTDEVVLRRKKHFEKAMQAAIRRGLRKAR